jgi:predicted neutral ceramidase superfamily lipid hydrolase
VALNLIPFILQSLIMLGIIIAMNFSVTQLRVMVNNSPWVPSTPLQVNPN